jgi:branched-chain amino acid transport system ATP-binding protein
VSNTLLEANAVDAGYGEIQVLRNVSFKIERGMIAACIGSNGAGKSTLMKTIAGLVPVSQGTIQFEGERIEKLPAEERAQRGVHLLVEGRGIFNTLTVEENLLLGSYNSHARSTEWEHLKHVYNLLPRLKERRKQLTGTLSGGEQQMLVIGRTIMADPKLLIIDEPSLGLSPRIVSEVYDLIMEIRKRGMTILLVEQNAKLALEAASFTYVMENGRIVAGAPSTELANSDKIREAYLGI